MKLILITSLICASCSRQSPVQEITNIQAPPSKVNVYEAQKLLNENDDLSSTVEYIKSNHASNFDWGMFWLGLPEQMNLEKMDAKHLDALLSLGAINCEKKALDNYGKFSKKMSLGSNQYFEKYLIHLQKSHFACFKSLNKFQVNQLLSLYKIKLEAPTREEYQSILESHYVAYLKFLASLDYFEFGPLEKEILVTTNIHRIVKGLSKSDKVEELVQVFRTLRSLVPYQSQLWQVPLKALVHKEDQIVKTFKSLDLSELTGILETISDFIAKEYKVETQLELNSLLIKRINGQFTKNRPSSNAEVLGYVSSLSLVASRIYYLQKTIFKNNINGFLAANDGINYELGAATKGITSYFLQANYEKLEHSPYFLYLDKYIRRIEKVSFQNLSIQYDFYLDEFEKYFIKRNLLETEIPEQKKDQIFNELCLQLGVKELDISTIGSTPGCYDLKAQKQKNIRLENLKLRINDHSFFRGYDQDISWELASLSGGVFNLSAKKEHREQNPIPVDVTNNSIVLPLVMGLKYTNPSNENICFTNGNTYYFPYFYTYRDTHAGYLPENYSQAKKGFSGGSFKLSVRRDAFNVSPIFISHGGQGQTGSKGMPAGKGRSIQFSESKVAFDFVDQMANESNQYVLSGCRNIENILELVKHAETGTFSGEVSKKTFIDLGYLNYFKQEDQDLFEKDLKVFVKKDASYCTDENCIFKALGKDAMKQMVSQLLNAQNEGAEVTRILPENLSNYRVIDNPSSGPSEPNGEDGSNGKFYVEYH